MASLTDPGVQELLARPNYCVISTINKNGSIHDTIVWISAENGSVAVNSASDRLWPRNLERDPRVTVLVFDSGNPYNYLEIRGKAKATRDGALDHINALAKKYMDQDEYPYLQPGEERVKFVIEADHVRHVKM
jgi:PPOX class probable F420-dependent enzyme